MVYAEVVLKRNVDWSTYPSMKGFQTQIPSGEQTIEDTYKGELVDLSTLWSRRSSASKKLSLAKEKGDYKPFQKRMQIEAEGGPDDEQTRKIVHNVLEKVLKAYDSFEEPIPSDNKDDKLKGKEKIMEANPQELFKDFVLPVEIDGKVAIEQEPNTDVCIGTSSDGKLRVLHIGEDENHFTYNLPGPEDTIPLIGVAPMTVNLNEEDLRKILTEMPTNSKNRALFEKMKAASDNFQADPILKLFREYAEVTINAKISIGSMARTQVSLNTIGEVMAKACKDLKMMSKVMDAVTPEIFTCMEQYRTIVEFMHTTSLEVLLFMQSNEDLRQEVIEVS